MAFLAWIFGVLIGWEYDTVRHDYKMAEIPQSVQTLIAVLMTGKVVQKFHEEPSTDAEVQIKETKQITAKVDENDETKKALRVK